MLEILKLVFNFIGIAGACVGTRRKAHLGLMNGLYGINNIFSIGYFIYMKEYGYLLQSTVFACISLWGVINWNLAQIEAQHGDKKKNTSIFTQIDRWKRKRKTSPPSLLLGRRIEQVLFLEIENEA